MPTSPSAWSSSRARTSAPAWRRSPQRSNSRWRRSAMAERENNLRETWITGIGIVSCLGEGLDAHWQGLNAAPPAADATSFAPYIVHRIVPLEFDRQIPKKGDQRQMEPWQRIGTYAAGLALDDAKVKGNTELLARMDMIVAAGGGERDLKADDAILGGLMQAAN